MNDDYFTAVSVAITVTCCLVSFALWIIYEMWRGA